MPRTFALTRSPGESRLDFRPAPPAQPTGTWAEFPEGASAFQGASVDRVPLTSAVVDAFERDARAAFRAVDVAEDYDSLALALERAAGVGRAFREGLIGPLRAALRRHDGMRAAKILEWANVRRLPHGWATPTLPDPGRRSKQAEFSAALATRGRWLRDARDLLRRGLDLPRESLRILGDGALVLEVPRPRNVQLAGHPVRLVGIESLRDVAGERGAQRGERAVWALEAGLRFLRERADKVLPGLMRWLPPVVVADDACDWDGGLPRRTAFYEPPPVGPAIMYCGETLAGQSPREVARVLAHEAGHHLWRVVLDAGAQATWASFLRETEATIDLGYLLSRWPEGDPWTSAVMAVRRERPELAEILEGAFEHGELAPYASDRELVAALARKGGVVRAPSRLTTAYGVKNPEEAFCDTLGTLAAYGTSAVLPDVAQWLRAVVPSVRTMTNPSRRRVNDHLPPPMVDPLRPIEGLVSTSVVVASSLGPASMRHQELWIVATKSGRERPWTTVVAANSESNARRILDPYREAGARVALVPPHNSGGLIALREGAGCHRQGRPAHYVERPALPVEEWDDGRRVTNPE